MTVSSTTRIAGPYSCDGSTQDFTFSFAIDTSADLRVVLTDSDGAETDLTLTTHYSVTSASENDATDFRSGGTVTTVAQYASGYTITLIRNTELTQRTDLPDTNQLADVEQALDKLTCIIQDLEDRLNRCLHWKDTASASIETEFEDAGTAGYLYQDADGDLSRVTTGLDTTIPVSTYWQTGVAKTTQLLSLAYLGVDHTITPQMYGAEADGTTDDTAALQAAIDAAITSGKMLIIPGGTYLISTTLDLADGTDYIYGLNIQGVGMPTIQWGGSGSDVMLNVQNLTESRIAGFYLDGDSTSGMTGMYITATTGKGSKRSVFDRVIIQNCPTIGLRLGDTTNDPLCDYLIFENCDFKGNGVNVSFQSDNARNVEFRNGTNLNATTYGVEIVAGRLVAYDHFWADNTTSDIHLNGEMASFYINGGGSESAVILTTGAAAQTQVYTMCPSCMIGFTQDDEPVPSTTVATYDASLALTLINCRFQHNFAIGTNAVSVVSINTRFAPSGAFTGQTDRVAQLGTGGTYPDFYNGAWTVWQDTDYPWGVSVRNVDDDYTCEFYRVGSSPDSYYYKKGSIAFMDTPVDNCEWGWICLTAGDFGDETTKATWTPIGWLGYAGTVHRLGSALIGMQTADGTQAIFTATNSAIVTHIIVHSPTASLAGGTSFSFGTGANADSWKTGVNLAGVTGSTKCYVVTNNDSAYTMVSSGTAFNIKPVTGSTADASARVIAYGIEV